MFYVVVKFSFFQAFLFPQYYYQEDSFIGTIECSPLVESRVRFEREIQPKPLIGEV